MGPPRDGRSGDLAGRARRGGADPLAPRADRQRELPAAWPCWRRWAASSPASTPRATRAAATTAAARSSTWPRTWPVTERRSSSAPSTPTCSRTPVRRPTWPSSTPCCERGDTVMGLSLDQGGHLTHGSPVNFCGQYYNFVPYQRRPRVAPHRHGRGARRGPRAPAQAHRHRRHRLPAAVGLRRLPRDRRRGRRAADDRHGAFRRSRRGGRAPVAGAATRTS